MTINSPKLKLKSGLKIINVALYKFYISLENLSMEELRRNKGIYQLSLNRKNDKGLSVKLDLSLYSKVILQLHQLKQPIKKGFMTIKADNSKRFSLLFEMNIKKSLIKKHENLFQVDIKHSLKDSYEIKGQYCCTEETLNKIMKDYQIKMKQSEIKNQETKKLAVTKELNVSYKKEKGIKKASSSSYRKCMNCHYQSKGTCGLLGIKVESYEVCKRFYAPRYRTVSGGGFSPR